MKVSNSGSQSSEGGQNIAIDRVRSELYLLKMFASDTTRSVIEALVRLGLSLKGCLTSLPSRKLLLYRKSSAIPAIEE